MDPADDLPESLDAALQALAQGRDARALPLLDEAHAALAGTSPATRSRGYDLLGWAFQRRGRHRDAEEAFATAQEARGEDPDATPLTRAEGLARLAWAQAIRVRQEDPEEGFGPTRELLRRALDTQVEALGAEHPRVRAARARLEAFERRRFAGDTAS